MRTFIGADFSRDIKDSIAGVQHIVRENRKGEGSSMWELPPDVKFFGELSSPKRRISEELRDIALKH